MIGEPVSSEMLARILQEEEEKEEVIRSSLQELCSEVNTLGSGEALLYRVRVGINSFTTAVSLKFLVATLGEKYKVLERHEGVYVYKEKEC